VGPQMLVSYAGKHLGRVRGGGSWGEMRSNSQVGEVWYSRLPQRLTASLYIVCKPLPVLLMVGLASGIERPRSLFPWPNPLLGLLVWTLDE